MGWQLRPTALCAIVCHRVFGHSLSDINPFLLYAVLIAGSSNPWVTCSACYGVAGHPTDSMASAAKGVSRNSIEGRLSRLGCKEAI